MPFYKGKGYLPKKILRLNMKGGVPLDPLVESATALIQDLHPPPLAFLKSH